MDSEKVYLLKIVTPDKSYFKIGYTKGSVWDRIKALQTGCPFEIIKENEYISENARKIEKSLHNIHKPAHMHGEWFELDVKESFNFKNLCEKFDGIFTNLKNNNNKCN